MMVMGDGIEMQTDTDPGIAAAEAALQEERLERLLEQGEKMDEEVREFRKYSSFLADHATSDEGMRNVLVRHFPGRFGREGTQPIHGYNGSKLFGLYQGVRRTARKIVGK